MPRPTTYPANEAAKHRKAPDMFFPKSEKWTDEETRELIHQWEPSAFARKMCGWLIQQVVSGEGICFYPASGSLDADAALDLDPLRTFSHLCDTFVFCDHYPDFEDSNHSLGSAVQSAIERLGAGLSCPWPNLKVEPLAERQEVLDDLASTANLPDDLPLRDAVPDRLFRWEELPEMNRQTSESHLLHYVPVYRQIGGFERELHLYFFDIEGVTLFWNLFARRGIAPEVLCIKRADRHHRNWTAFRFWNEALGRCVDASPAKPRIVCAAGPSETDWPWNRKWQEHPDWDGAISWVQGTEALPVISCDPLLVEGGSVVEVRYGGEQTGPDRNLCRNRSTQSLFDALSELPPDRDLDVTIEGFSDEGCALLDWRRVQTTERRLTIYAKDPGQVVSFGPYADGVT